MAGDGGGDVGFGGGGDKGGGGGGDFAGGGYDVPAYTGPSVDTSAPVSYAADAAAPAATASPFVIDSPIQAGSLDYLGAGPGAASDVAGGGTNVSPGPGFVTSDAMLGTGSAPPSVLSGSGAGPSFSDWTTNINSGQPFAGGGTTGITSPDAAAGTPSVPAAAGGSSAAFAPTAGTSATSLAPAGASAASGTPADATSSWADMLKKGLTSNPLGTAISAAGLGYNILNGQKQTANQAALTTAAGKSADTGAKLADAGIAQVGTNQTNAAEIGAKGKDLEQYLTTGQLPAQYTTQIDQAINDAKTTAISNAAKNGQPTDPTKNTSLAQQLAQIDNQRAGMTSKIAETLFNAGAGLTSTAANVGNASASSLLSGGQSAANLSGQLYTTLTGIDSKQSEQTAAAIAALAKSLNSGTPAAKAA